MDNTTGAPSCTAAASPGVCCRFESVMGMSQASISTRLERTNAATMCFEHRTETCRIRTALCVNLGTTVRDDSYWHQDQDCGLGISHYCAPIVDGDHNDRRNAQNVSFPSFGSDAEARSNGVPCACSRCNGVHNHTTP